METTDTWLDEEELDRVVCDEETGVYLFDGEFCESRDEAYEQILQDKLKLQNN
jgi:hypothetical protein